MYTHIYIYIRYNISLYMYKNLYTKSSLKIIKNISERRAVCEDKKFVSGKRYLFVHVTITLSRILYHPSLFSLVSFFLYIYRVSGHNYRTKWILNRRRRYLCLRTIILKGTQFHSVTVHCICLPFVLS